MELRRRFTGFDHAQASHERRGSPTMIAACFRSARMGLIGFGTLMAPGSSGGDATPELTVTPAFSQDGSVSRCPHPTTPCAFGIFPGGVPCVPSNRPLDHSRVIQPDPHVIALLGRGRVIAVWRIQDSLRPSHW
jgi:hypothetical protein